MDPAIRKIESRHTRHGAARRPMKTKRYFHPVFASRPVSDAGARRCTSGSRAVMDDSVAKHMRADVTVGAFLSGGIDSTAIAALAKRYNPDLMTFTTGFEREGFSEVDVAAESAAAIGVRHVIRTVSEQELTETLPLIIWYLDDPVADPALVPLYFVANEARKHVKVVLSGEGADELFGGYNIYREPSACAALPGCPAGCARAWPRSDARCRRGSAGRTCSAAARWTWRSGTTATPGSSARSSCRRCCAPTTRRARSATSPTRSTRRRPRPTRSPGCSTSTCSPGCAATSWSRPTR